ncbi:MAG: PTS glucose transporter subunit IIA [Erysipelotrichaceae bacterium]|nr:PTS glucose transporter subunit IIA [Erysipelotrichaceae bacterium]
MILNIFKKKKSLELSAVVKGKTIPLEQVNDPVFANKMMGDGIAFVPSDNTIYAPCDAQVMMLSDTLHAIGLKAHNDVEIMIHIGLDSVKLAGNGFRRLYEKEHVQKGEPLICFDPEVMSSNNIDMTTMLIVVNSKDHACHDLSLDRNVGPDDTVMCVD